MAKLFLLRHLKSQWNKDNRFAGWVDNPLSDEGKAQAKEIADKLASEKIDVAYSGSLIRIMETVLRVYDYIPEKYPLFIHLDGGRMEKWGKFNDMTSNDAPFYVLEDLNERYYGKVQGLNKEETKEKYGEDLVQLWRRGYKNAPPGGETMEQTYKRAVPVFKKYIQKDLKAGKNVLVVASHNSLRAIVKYIEGISDEAVAKVELPFGSFMDYEFDAALKLVSKKYFT